MQVKMNTLSERADAVVGAKKRGLKGIDKKYKERS